MVEFWKLDCVCYASDNCNFYAVCLVYIYVATYGIFSSVLLMIKNCKLVKMFLRLYSEEHSKAS